MPSIHRTESGSYAVHWRAEGGKQQKRTFPTEEAASAFARGVVTVESYGERWLKLAPVEETTRHAYEVVLRCHVNPVLGPLDLRGLDRGTIRSFLAGKAAAGLSSHTVRRIYSVLRNMLTWAVDDGLLAGNPAARLGRKLGLKRQEQARALTRQQRDRLLTTAKGHALYPLFLTLERAGLRLGEALALRVEDIDLSRSTIHVCRSVSFLSGETKAPKNGNARTVDASPQLRAALANVVRGKARDARLFELAPSTVQHALKPLLEAAGLPRHFSPHCLRHTFATLLLEAGVDVAYVSQQLGHGGIAITADTYGRGRRPASRVGVLDS